MGEHLTPEVIDEGALITTLTDRFQGRASNSALRAALGWQDDSGINRYWSVRNRLVQKGRVMAVQGSPGGMTVIVENDSIRNFEADRFDDTAEDSTIKYNKEKDLYEDITIQIDQGWYKQANIDSRIVRNTSTLGRRDTGGTWTRPDVSVVAIRKFKFLPSPVFDVISFEIKPAGQINVLGVFEALSHRQNTTRSYVLYHTSKKLFDESDESDRIESLAEQHGIGILLAENPSDFLTWVEVVGARRWSPDPEYVNEFIERTFPNSDHDEILKLIK